MKALLLLEDGALFEGVGFGARGLKCGEVVFNTSMTGYQEILTDPSYNEQIITMTYPLIGNVGTNSSDRESRRVFASGFIVRENCQFPSNWRNTASLDDYLKRHNVIGLAGIDTRGLVKHIRTEGAMRGIISSTELRAHTLKKKLNDYPGLVGRDIVKDVTIKIGYHVPRTRTVQGVGSSGIRHAVCQYPTVECYKANSKLKTTPAVLLRKDEAAGAKLWKVVAFDYGIKLNILRLLCSHGCDVYVVPADTSASEVLARKPDGVFLSNGPGDPAAVKYAIETVRELLGTVPIFGICLGHQILALAMGAKTYKLKFGHRGANHPVKNLITGKIEITTQNHGFCVDMDSLRATAGFAPTSKKKDIELTHVNLNDNTVEGIRCKKLAAFSVQYHPEASPGPHDATYLFKTFIELMGR